ncbi:MAG: hypothetical protein JW995_01950 [Melioribacteraceae bacterium]|nr:hypothetical protein [Melioribacteraceae bacterium]
MKISLIQQTVSDNIEKNILKGLKNARTAAENGAKIISFAELAFTKFYPQKKAGLNVLELAETIPGPTTNAFSKLAKELGIVIILNLYEHADNKAFD